MRRVRRRLAVICLLLFAEHGVALVARTVVACCEPPRAAAARAMDCCREGSGAHVCPLKPATGRGGCRLRAGCAVDDAGVAGVVWAGVVPERTTLTRVLTSTILRTFSEPTALDWIQPPLTPSRGASARAAPASR